MFQDLVILFQDRKDLLFHGLAYARLQIVMLVLALFTAEFLIRAAVTYRFAALETFRQMSFPFLNNIIHICKYYHDILTFKLF